jgi:Skp family chaperone for outer membrane proteins
MNKLIISAALAASALALPTAALAQTAPILIVDSERILSDCSACKSATTQLEQKQTALRTRAQTLQQELQGEGKPLKAAVDALAGKQPGPALQQKIIAFQTKQQNAEQELQSSEQTLKSTVANVQQQIANKLVTIVDQVRARRGAAIVLSKGSTLANDNAIDVTTEVLAALNQQLPAVSVTPLPQQQQQQPQGR